MGEDVLKSCGGWGNDMESPRRWVQLLLGLPDMETDLETVGELG